MSREVTLYLKGFPSQRVKVRLVEVRGGAALTSGEHGRARFCLDTGRRVQAGGTPEPWDFWRLSAEDRRALVDEQNRGAP